MESLLDYALAYAAMGWSVFPCHHPIKKTGWNCSCEAWKRKHNSDYECDNAGKHPRTKNGLDDATTDLDQIKEWWKRWPDANIGINCGASGLLVVDLDTYKDIYDGDDLELDEETITGLSGGGGSHLFYCLDPSDTFGNSTKGLPDGVDIRGHGGYVVVAPSNHASGGTYQWELEYSPWDRPASPLPLKLRELLENSKKEVSLIEFDTTKKYTNQGTVYGLAALNKQCSSVTSAANGTRNNILNTAAFSLARLVAGGELDYNYTYDNLYAAALSVELSDAEAKQTIDSGMEAGIRQPYSTVTLDDDYNGFGQCPEPPEWISNNQVDQVDDVVNPVHLAEIQDAIEHLFKAGNPIETIREKLWRAIGNLSISDRRLLSSFLFNLGLFSSVKLAGKFVDECASSVNSIPLIERITDAISSLGHEFKLNMLEDAIEVDEKRIDDIFMSRLYLLMEDKKFNQRQVDNGVAVLAQQDAYHPIRDYLLTIEWDGQKHYSRMIRHLHGDNPNVNNTPLHHLLIRRWLLGCVARGIDGDKESAFKHQTPMLVTIGPQGIGKSSWIRWLVSGVGIEYHRESPIDPHNTNDVRSLVNKWIWEISELGSSLRKSDRDALKSIITQEWHTYRKPWGRNNITKPALCNLSGTINPENGFLDDPTGNRRFLPVNIDYIDHDYANIIDIDQMWAELVAAYLNGESPELTEHERKALQIVHEANESENPLATYIHMYFKVEPGSENIRCSTAEIIERLRSFNVALNPNLKVAAREINDVLAPMRLTRKRWNDGNSKVWGWFGIEPTRKTPFGGFS